MAVSSLVAAGGGTTMKVQEFTSSGTFTVPSNCTAVKVFAVGAGGGGAGARWASGSANTMGGGGGGGVVFNRDIAVTAGESITVTIGAGGAGGSGSVAGAVGSSSSFGSYVTAFGGNGGWAWIAGQQYPASTSQGSHGGSGGGSHSGGGGGAAKLFPGTGADANTNTRPGFKIPNNPSGGIGFPKPSYGGWGNSTPAGQTININGMPGVEGYGGGGSGASDTSGGGLGFDGGGSTYDPNGPSAINGQAGVANSGGGGSGAGSQTGSTYYSGGAGGSGYIRVTYWA